MPLDAVTGQTCQYTELQNNSGWKGCLEISCITGCSEQGQPDQVALHVSEVGGPTAPLGLRASLGFQGAKVLYVSHYNFLCFSLCPWPLVPSLCTSKSLFLLYSLP